MENEGNKTKTTNAERCKRYREKNSDEYKVKDALRKKRSRMVLKNSAYAYAEHKRRKRERIHYAKIKKNKSSDTSNALLYISSLSPSLFDSSPSDFHSE